MMEAPLRLREDRVYVEARKDDKVVKGLLWDDGLTDIWGVETDDGTKCVSTLWTFDVWRVIDA